MSGVPRIELSEIYFKYKHHPTIVDLFVEGEFDRDVFNQLFRELKLGSFVSIFTPNDVNLPDAVLAGMKLTIGSNKHRLLALAALLNDELAGISANVTCLVDADQDRLLGVLRTVPHLAYTTHTCMEMHCLADEPLRKFFVVSSNCTEEEVGAFKQLAAVILPVQFCLRAINERLNLAATIPSATRGLTKRGLSTFSAPKYCDVFIATNHLYARQPEIANELQGMLAAMPADLRDKAHGHDFIELIFAYLAEAGRLKLQSSSHVTDFGGRLVMSAVTADELSADPVHSRIIAAARGSSPMWLKPATS
jgi:hypothetical protein